MDKTPNQTNFGNKINLNDEKMKLFILFIIIFIIGILWLMRYFKNNIEEGESSSFTKKFLNFFRNKFNDNNINNHNNSNYPLTGENTEKNVIKFINEFCKNSPNIYLKSKNELNISFRKKFKFDFNVYYENISVINGKKYKNDSILTIIPLNNCLIDLEEDNLRNLFVNLINNTFNKNKKYLVNNYNLDILYNQKILIKIYPIYSFGSLRDLIYSTNPLNSFEKKSLKYKNKKGKPLQKKKISKISRQILLLLKRLHKNNIYHLNLHSGNVLIDSDFNIKINDLEMIIFSKYKRQDEIFFNDLFEYYLSNPIGNFLKVFEAIDIISFGKILYEISTGNEMETPYLNLKNLENIDKDIIDILKLIFPQNNICSSSVKQLLKMDLVKNNFIDEEQENNEMNDDDDDNFIIIHFDDDSDSEQNNENSNQNTDDKFKNLKNILFNEKQFLEKLKQDKEITTSL